MLPDTLQSGWILILRLMYHICKIITLDYVSASIGEECKSKLLTKRIPYKSLDQEYFLKYNDSCILSDVRFLQSTQQKYIKENQRR